MREAISNTAELGALLGGKRIVDDGVRERMADVLAEVRAGRFADELKARKRAATAAGKARAEARDAARKDLPRLSGEAISRSAAAELRAGRRRSPARDRRAAACDGPWRRRGRRRSAQAPAPRQHGARNRCGHRRHRAPPAGERALTEDPEKSRQASAPSSFARSIASLSTRLASSASPHLPDPHPFVGLRGPYSG